MSCTIHNVPNDVWMQLSNNPSVQPLRDLAYPAANQEKREVGPGFFSSSRGLFFLQKHSTEPLD